MRFMIATAMIVCLQLGCDGGNGGPGGAGAGGGGAGGSGAGAGPPVQSAPGASNPQDAMSAPPGTACQSGTQQCGDGSYCCPGGTLCLANPYGLYCTAEFCCQSCPGGVACGAGCCPAGAGCAVNDGSSDCGSELCCTTQGEAPCPGDVAARCPSGTACLPNKSAKACGDFACYTADGFVACPDEVACPNGVDFCQQGTHCLGWSGVCETTSSSGNYCCKAAPGVGESCDHVECAPGLICVPNPHCPDTDPTATSTCRTVNCEGAGEVDCGNYCCSANFPVCAGDCYCNAQ